MPKPPPSRPSPYTPAIEIDSPKAGAIFAITDTITINGLASLTCEDEGGDCIGNTNLNISRVEVALGNNPAQPATLGKTESPGTNGTDSSSQWTFTASPPSTTIGQMPITAYFYYNEGRGKTAPPVQTTIEVQIQEARFSGNTIVGAGAAASGNMFVTVVVDTDGRIYYSYSVLSGQPSQWIELPGAPSTDAPPAVALVGDNHDYMLVWIKTAGATGSLVLNQGHLGQGFVGWR